MEDDLKTLKDIEMTTGFRKLRIKAEAIKWVKHMDDKESMKERREGTTLNASKSEYAVSCTKEWVKMFFNITEEDLK